jgi:hypothetical protein
MAALNALQSQPRFNRHQVDADVADVVGLDDLQALQAPSRSLRPEEMDLEGALRQTGFSARLNAADDLRLPAPPTLAQDARALFQGAARVLSSYRSQASSPVVADPKALVAEARMVALLTGIHRLQLEIRSRAAETQSA